MIKVNLHDSMTSPLANAQVGAWVSYRIFGRVDAFERYSSAAVVDNGSIIGGVVFHNWQPDAGVIEFSAASSSRRWLTPSTIVRIMSYPFDILGTQMVTTRTSEHNADALRVNEYLGFRFTRIPRLRGRNEAEIIGCLTDDDWRDHPIYKRSLRG